MLSLEDFNPKTGLVLLTGRVWWRLRKRHVVSAHAGAGSRRTNQFELSEVDTGHNVTVIIIQVG